jgi:hypothetical protein
MPFIRCIACLALLAAGAVRPQVVTLVPENAPKRVLVPAAAVNSAWRQAADFDDSGWTAATGGAGYDAMGGYRPWIGLDLTEPMVTSAGGSDRTAMIRIPFDVTGDLLAASQAMILRVRYDDGFAAFLNGQKIAWAYAPSNARFDSRATAGHEAGPEPEDFDVTSAVPYLNEGANLLAVQGFNAAPADTDFLVSVSLELDTTPPPPVSSNLPLVCVRTFGRGLRQEQRITVHLSVVDHGPGRQNTSTDPPDGWSGWAGMEIRGQSSAYYPKNSYNLETRKADGNSENVPLLGFPGENDWILYGPYVDRSLMRNALLYRLSNRMGRYASRSRFCELVLNGRPRGVYVLLEKIKRDRNRVAVAELDSSDVAGDPLTGGYIVKIDKPGNESFASAVPPWPGAHQRIAYQYHYPEDDAIAPEQKTYIQSFIRSFEAVLNGPDPASGYGPLVDLGSFVDHFLLNEICKNVDGYRLSAFFSKQRDSRGGRLSAGPVWDMDLGIGNANYYGADDTENWQIDNLTVRPDARSDGSPPPFFWKKFLADPAFRSGVYDRWNALRGGALATDSVLALVDAMADTLREAQARNFELWPGPGEQGEGFWPVPWIFDTFESYDDEVEYVKSWLSSRFEWMDAAIASFAPDSGLPAPEPGTFGLAANYPNPFNLATTVRFSLADPVFAELTVLDAAGRKVITLSGGRLSAGMHRTVWDGKGDSGNVMPSGIYFCRLKADGRTAVIKMVLLK